MVAKGVLEAERRIALLDENGWEIPDPTPVSLPLGFRRPERLAETIQRLVRTQLSQLAEARGMESFEESEDFDVGDDHDPASPYETFFDPILGKDLSPDEFKRNEAIYKERFLKDRKAYYEGLEKQGLLQELEKPVRQARTKSPEAQPPRNEEPPK